MNLKERIKRRIRLILPPEQFDSTATILRVQKQSRDELLRIHENARRLAGTNRSYRF